jgi:hypothetical protein
LKNNRWWPGAGFYPALTAADSGKSVKADMMKKVEQVQVNK